MVKKDEEEVDEDYIFKFIGHYICKPIERGFEDVIQCQSNLQKMHLQGQKQLSDLELKVDNTNAHHQSQLKSLKSRIKSSR